MKIVKMFKELVLGKLKMSQIKNLINEAIAAGDYEAVLKLAEEALNRKNRPFTIDECKEFLGIHITVKHTGKMSGMFSISTLCEENPKCKEHAAVKGSICEHCFAMSLVNMRKSMKKPLKQNSDILNNIVIPVNYWPALNVRLFRFESFGDLASDTQVINYVNLCKRNPDTKFALWTKNYRFIKEAIDAGNEKPENLVIIVSSLMLNVQLQKRFYPYADKIFTVYENEEAAAANNACINCGKRHCLTCGRCYRKDTETYVNELLK